MFDDSNKNLEHYKNYWCKAGEEQGVQDDIDVLFCNFCQIHGIVLVTFLLKMKEIIDYLKHNLSLQMFAKSCKCNWSKAL